MATYYPLIANNTSANSKLDLYSGSTDSIFDTYTFTDTANDSQVLYMLFVIKNTHISTDSSLAITEISGNAEFNEDFTIDPLLVDDLLLGLTSNNLAQTISTISATNTGYTAANTTDGTTGSCTGASAFIGHNGSITPTGEGINDTGSSYLIPIYKTTSTDANKGIVGHNIPYNSYASFLIKFQPTEAKSLNGTPTLTIKNNDNDIVLSFSGNVTNPLAYYAKIGTSTGVNILDDVFTSNGESIRDGEVFDLGLYPVNYKYADTDKTLYFSDHSANAGNFEYDFAGSPSFRSVCTVSSTLNNVDGVNYVGTANTDADYLDFDASWKSDGSKLVEIGMVSSENAPSVSFNLIGKNTDVYKNFSLNSESEIHLKPTHFKESGARGIELYNYNKHTTADSSYITRYVKIGKIINTVTPSDTANNQFFVFGVKVGFYSVLTMNALQTDYHFIAKSGSDKKEKICSNLLVNSTSSDGPCFFKNGSSSSMTREDKTTIILSARYNYFNTTTLNTDEFKVPEFSLRSQTGLYSSYTNVEGDLNTYPTEFLSGTGNEFTSHNETITGSTAIDSNTTYNVFSDTANSGNFLKLIYKPDVNRFMAEHMYNFPIANNTKYNVVTNENPFGFYTAQFIPSEGGSTAFWSKFANNDYSANYNVGFFPKFSHLRLLASSGENVLNSQGVSATVNVRLFTDTQTSSARNYSTNTEKVILTDSNPWRVANSTTAANSNQTILDGATNAVTTEGSWYGAGKAYISNPTCWNYSGVRQGQNNNNNPYIGHFPKSTYRTTTSGAASDNKFDEEVNYYFKLPAASYNQSSAKWRSVGRFYFDNTGDYPIYIQAVELKDKNFTNLEGGTVAYQSTIEALLPPKYDNSNNEVNSTYKPDAANSPTPSWTVYHSNKNGDNASPVAWSYNGYGLGHGAQSVNFPDNLTLATNAKTHYHDNNLYVADSVYNASKTNKRLFVEPQVEGGFFSRTDSNSQVKSNKKENYIDIAFEVTPTNNSSYDNGVYYTQVAISYYVDEYDNRQLVEADENGYTTSPLSLGQTNNTRSRLYVSKYLVACELTSTAELTLVDTEGDEHTTSIDLPALSIG